jgi:predicted GNAT superfamily acetyltransferase
LNIQIRLLDTAAQMSALETLQLEVWPGSKYDVVPLHLLVSIAGNGGLVIGAYDGDRLVGFVFGFPGLALFEGEVKPKHCSHMTGVHPDYQGQGIGFALKQAQWQMVRHQGLDLITWTYDPLESRNAILNISKLGGICHTYKREIYGDMRDDLNIGLPSDRFQVDLWVNGPRATERIGKKPRARLDLAHYLEGGISAINPTTVNDAGLPVPPDEPVQLPGSPEEGRESLIMVEIPAEFQQIKKEDQDLALVWRLHTRELFETLFDRGYLVTDALYLPSTNARSFYILIDGEAQLGF